jgi:hypothetical protein
LYGYTKKEKDFVMKDVIVTLKLKVKDDASIEEVVNDIDADPYGCIEEVVSVEGNIVQDDIGENMLRDELILQQE